MNKLFIPVLLGTAREGRFSEKAARYVFEELKARADIETELVDVREFNLSASTHNAPEKWKKVLERADALFIVSPEYNHSFPGELKILLDTIDEEMDGKPVAVAGVSSGKFGGARMVGQLVQLLVKLGMIPLSAPLLFPMIEQLFTAEGKITDDSYAKRVADIASQLAKLAATLNASRLPQLADKSI